MYEIVLKRYIIYNGNNNETQFSHRHKVPVLLEAVAKPLIASVGMSGQTKRRRTNGAAKGSNASSPQKIWVSSTFDSGNIEVVDSTSADNIQLKIRPEPYCEHDKITHFQWFHYRAAGVRGRKLTMQIVNAGQSSFPEAWPGTKACASYDLEFWFRIPTTYDAGKGVLSMTCESEKDVLYVAYFAPYTYARHRDFIARVCNRAEKYASLEVVGQSVQGRDIDVVKVDDGATVSGGGRPVVWIICRQHPGESMSEWFGEGLLERLLDPHDGVAEKLRRDAVFYVVPNMNPDGSYLGHLRTNAKGANLNREWVDPTPDYSPEVYHVLQKMDSTGCDMFIDVHGDEEFPCVFLAGEEGIPSFTPKMAELTKTFMDSFARVTPDFDSTKKNYYGVDAPGQADMTVANNAVGERFKCLSFTLEMPFKDVDDHPDKVQGWSPHRAKRFGESLLYPILHTLPHLKELHEQA